MFDNFFDQIAGLTGPGLVNLLTALAILIGGWAIARIVAFFVRRLLQRTRVVERLQGTVTTPAGKKAADRPNVEGWIAGIVFWVLMLVVLVAFFQTLNLTAVSGPLSALLNQVVTAAPMLLGAILILVLAWVVASLVRFLVLRALEATRFEERLRDKASLKAESTKMRQSIADGLFWLIFLLFLPAVLNTLGMQGLVQPVQGVVDQILAAVPRIFGAAIILVVGWFIARIVRQIVTNLLVAANADAFGARYGINSEGRSLSQLIGSIVYVLVLIPAVIAALNALEIDALSTPAITMLTTVLNGVPAFFGALLVLTIAYFAGKLAASLVTNLLAGIGFDSIPSRLGFDVKRGKGQASLSEIAGVVVLVGVMLLAAAEAARLLGLVTLAVVITGFSVWAGQAVAALFIFAIGLYLANLARSVILSASGGQAKMGANIARVAILVFVIALSLQQLGVATETVNLAFGILLGAIGIAAALAFGLGARDVAGRQVESWLQDSQRKPTPRK